MNREQRKSISDIMSRLEEIVSELSTICDEEQEKYDNLPESLQYGAPGERIQEGIEAITEASDYITSCSETLENIL